MTPLSRRELIKLLIAAGASPLIGRVSAQAQLDPGAVYPDGVIAGDPLPRGSIIWTRIVTAEQVKPVPVLWMVSEDEAFTHIVAGGAKNARARTGYTVKVRVGGLEPDRWYYYRFEVEGVASRVGRLRTAPKRGSNTPLRFAFASCQQRNASFYVAHRAIAEENVDFLMHLGDYIYVHDTADLTLEDYRRRYRLFRTNALLQDLHARVPLVVMWDDGEFYNGIDRTGDPVRLAAAKDAWFENMPVFAKPHRRAYRSFAWGSLADLFMIDVRAYRDPEVPTNSGTGILAGTDTRIPGGEQLFAPGRTTLGATQKRWFERQLGLSNSRWKLIGNPYNFNPLKLQDFDTPELREMNPNLRHNEGIYVANEAWDDYQAERREILEVIERREIDNVVFTSGHTHVFFASELQPDFDDPASPTLAFDFVTGSLTADPDPRELAPIAVLRAAEQLLIGQNQPYLKLVDLVAQGYGLVDCNPDELVVTFRSIDTFDIDAQPQTTAQFRIANGATQMERLV